MTSPFELVIFDCDGVLLDSERLAVRVESAVLTDLGWPLSEAEVIERFVGRTAPYMKSAVEAQLGRRVDWDREFEPHYRKVFDHELRPVAGVTELLERITTMTCVATNNERARVLGRLDQVGFAERFDGNVFCAEDVAHPKPAPDLYRHAARSMGVAPTRCAVIEDSVSGVRAGLAAGMTVFGYAGGVTARASLELDGVVVVDEMRELAPFLVGPW